jgi:hypothetical protein
VRRSSALAGGVCCVLVAVAVGCAAPPPARLPFPTPELDELSPTELLGYQIYLLDHAAWLATDAALESGLRDAPTEGWLAVPTGSGVSVRFIGPCGNAPCSYIDVQLGVQSLPQVAKLDPPLALPEEQAAMWRARQLAVGTEFRACTPTYNTVVVPAEHDGSPVWRVYLLAASVDSDDVVLTGHHRITVTADGRSILSAEALSKSCVISAVPAHAQAKALFITHVLDPEPIETHVFTSLYYGIPLFVGTEQGTFKVEGASIRPVEPK